jgi:predicted RNase H-like HicB family nuclease
MAIICTHLVGEIWVSMWPASHDQALNPLRAHRKSAMFAEYIRAALSKATYEIIEDEEPFYGEIPELRGVWAIGKTLEECRENLKGVIEGWIALRLRLGLAIPPINGMR